MFPVYKKKDLINCIKGMLEKEDTYDLENGYISFVSDTGEVCYISKYHNGKIDVCDMQNNLLWEKAPLSKFSYREILSIVGNWE